MVVVWHDWEFLFVIAPCSVLELTLFGLRPLDTNKPGPWVLLFTCRKVAMLPSLPSFAEKWLIALVWTNMNLFSPPSCLEIRLFVHTMFIYAIMKETTGAPGWLCRQSMWPGSLLLPRPPPRLTWWWDAAACGQGWWPRVNRSSSVQHRKGGWWRTNELEPESRKAVCGKFFPSSDMWIFK